MIIEISLPDVGLEEAEITEILVKIGDKVSLDQSILVVEGDKASIEIPSPSEGIVKDIKVSIGKKVKKNDLIMLFEQEQNQFKQGDSISSRCPEKIEAIFVKTDQNQDKLIIFPKIDEKNLKILEIFVSSGNMLSKDKPIISVKKEQSNVIVIVSPISGLIKNIRVHVGEKISYGVPMILVDPTKEKTNFSFDIEEKEIRPSFESRIHHERSYTYATPVIRRIAREFDIDLSKVIGSGRKGRILRKDIYSYVKQSIIRSELHHNYCSPKENLLEKNQLKEMELTRVKKISGKRLQKNWITIPHITQFEDVDISELENFRKLQNMNMDEKFSNVKITILPFLMKAVAKALQEMPNFNSSLSEDNQKIILKKRINIGIAVDTSQGLLVPVLRDVDKKNIIELSEELRYSVKKARKGKLLDSEMRGGCFTISNLGGIGGKTFTPIINAPEVAILGVSKSIVSPVWNGKKFVPKLMLPLSLSYDHRVIDGADGARFIIFIKKIMSDIRFLVL